MERTPIKSPRGAWLAAATTEMKRNTPTLVKIVEGNLDASDPLDLAVAEAACRMIISLILAQEGVA